VLVNLHQAVFPHLSNPIMLCDFLTRSYDVGGVVSVMALNSLFVLMMEHGLEYPNFYEKLYALLVPSIFMAKHRARGGCWCAKKAYLRVWGGVGGADPKEGHRRVYPPRHRLSRAVL
ncbi:nucleolar complex protein 4, partial [Trifolium pratense]